MKSIMSLQTAVLVQLTISHLFTTINAQQQQSFATVAACNAATDCTECMAADTSCNWCITSHSAENWDSTKKRCDTYTNLINQKCRPEDIKNITTEYLEVVAEEPRDATDSGLQAIQLSPQKLHVKLRPNEKLRFNVTFRLAKDLPVDLYYLMDLSQSMEDDKDKVANLGVSLANEMKKITKDVRLGFGSFVDKVLMPYVNTLPSRLKAPCADCTGPYSFKHGLNLTEDISTFGAKVDGTDISGNLDEPEGGLDALMQAIVCESDIGWRDNSRKMLIFSTDAPFHSAGDGKLGGVVEPNDGLCHMENGEYTWGTKQDYPSISQIASKVADNRANIIFAVTQDQSARYKALSDIIPGSVWGVLANDSSNIVALVRDNYNKISSKVALTVKRVDDNKDSVRIKIGADCDNDGKFADKAECGNLSPRGSVKFQVELQSTSCANAVDGIVTEKFQVYPTGLTESLWITADVDCACECGDTEASSSDCSGIGTYSCGTCDCGDSHYGEQCQCDASSIGGDNEDFNAPCKRPTTSNSTQTRLACEGRGECVCGTCQSCSCLPGYEDKNTCKRYQGKYCLCNPENCPRNSKGICSNRGTCQCDDITTVHACQCNEGYTGTECECPISQDSCRDPENSEVLCNGQASCECGVCKCEEAAVDGSERYTGQYCEECSTCASKCQPFKQCVQCFGYNEFGWEFESYDPKYCKEECNSTRFESVEDIETVDQTDFRVCTAYKSVHDDCKVLYGYEYVPRVGYTVYVQDEKVCPTVVNYIAIICGVIGGIVFLGLIALLIWRLVATLHDRREFAMFEKERQEAQWNQNENPIYEKATSTFKNPMYQGSMKKE